jgi:hypothetical protein
VQRIQLLQVQYGVHPTALFRYEKDGTDVTERRKKEWNFLYGSLEEEGFYLLINVEIVLAMRGGAELHARQDKRWGGGEVRTESLHGLQSVMGAAKDISPKRGEVFETAPYSQGCMRGAKKWSLRSADRGPRMEQGAVLGTARPKGPLASQLICVLDGRLSSYEKGGLLASGDWTDFGFW